MALQHHIKFLGHEVDKASRSFLDGGHDTSKKSSHSCAIMVECLCKSLLSFCITANLSKRDVVLVQKSIDILTY